MTTRACVDCRTIFYAREDYQIRCFECWRERKDAREWERNQKARETRERAWARPAPITLDPRLPVLTEWQEMLSCLIRLAHPDKHSGSQMSTRTIQWLLAQRNKLPGGAR